MTNYISRRDLQEATLHPRTFGLLDHPLNNLGWWLSALVLRPVTQQVDPFLVAGIGNVLVEQPDWHPGWIEHVRTAVQEELLS